ncbi:MAG: hypothetical protein A2536_09400 [Candidatus Firestonebacteria bacterium RIFOXYD2_FULL_39_29]|nr:MAG: hypothetical protein A2536_09400 [Candidatus Firestonebacteria bacterium RIFOXYD2_FULL_39_29]
MKSILIVDDEIGIRNLYCKILVENGFNVEVSDDIYEACKKLKNSNVDLILWNIEIPREVRSNLLDCLPEFERRFRLIVISVYSIEEQRLAVPNADDYFDKANGTGTLISKIKSVLRKKRLSNSGMLMKKRLT